MIKKHCCQCVHKISVPACKKCQSSALAFQRFYFYFIKIKIEKELEAGTSVTFHIHLIPNNGVEAMNPQIQKALQLSPLMSGLD